MNQSSNKSRKAAVKNQLVIHKQAEHLMAELSKEANAPIRMEVFKLQNSCGSIANGMVEVFRVRDSRGIPYAGGIQGINKCLNPVCPYCNPELVAAEQMKLIERLSELTRTSKIENTVSYSGSFTCEHHGGERISGLIALLRGALKEFHKNQEVKLAIAGAFFSIEFTTGKGKNDGAHPHIQFIYTFKGSDEREHRRILNLAEPVFREYIEAHSVEVLGVLRGVTWDHEWFSWDGYGVSGFFGRRNPNWTPIEEVTNGFAKNGGLCLALTPDEYAEFYLAQRDGKWFGAYGCWEYPGEPPKPTHHVIATISPQRWNQLHVDTKRILRTVAMDTDHWKDDKVSEYMRIANQAGLPHVIDFEIQRLFSRDFAMFPDSDSMIIY